MLAWDDERGLGVTVAQTCFAVAARVPCSLSPAQRCWDLSIPVSS